MSDSPPPTPSQTVGPFYGFGLPFEGGRDVVPPWHPDAITVTGRVLDGAGAPVIDALVEIWQADPAGRTPPTLRAAADPRADGGTAGPTKPAGVLRRAPGGVRDGGHSGFAGFSGFGRCATDADGRYHFSTLKPGVRGLAAPYLAMLVFARGLLKPVATRVYFAEDTAAHATDPLLRAVDPDRRGTLITNREDGAHRFDVRLQGAKETVFLAY